MRLLRRPGLVLAAVAVAITLPTIATGAPAANKATFQDSTGEDATAPDITTITVSNADTGILSFNVAIPNRPTLGADMVFELWVDSDNNSATGDPSQAGVDYVIQLVTGEINLYKWDGTGFTRRFGDPSALTLRFSYKAGITINISAAELGNTKKLRFYVDVISGCTIDPVSNDLDCTNAKGDIAPGGGAGLYPFEVKITKPTLVVKSLRPTPAKPTAGQPFTLRLVAARSDTGAVVQNGRATCVGRVGSSRISASAQRVQGGAAVCTWNLPANAKGKTFRGSVAVVFEGLRASQSYTGTIR